MKMLEMIVLLSMVMWYIIDRAKPMWESLKNGKYITMVVSAVFAALLVSAYNGWRKEGIWLQNGRLTLRRQHGFHLHDICVLCPVPALTAMQSPWAAAVHRTNLTLTFPGGVKCRVRSVKCSELPFLLF